jgi:hypothetical protein
MNRYVKIGIITLGIIVSLVAVATFTMNQHGNTKMNEIYTFPAPEERVIASFGLNETNPDRTVFLENPNLMDSFIIASEADIQPYHYPDGPVIGFGKEGNGSVAVMIDETWEVNQSVVNTIYDRLSARGKTFNIKSVPCKFIRMSFLKSDIAKDTMP